MNKVQSMDLTKESPRSPRVRVGGYAILGRTLDKCRAFLAGTIGEYHSDCPLDNMLFGFKGIQGSDFKAEVEKGRSDDQMVEWVNTHGKKKSPEEIKAWSSEVEKTNPTNDPEKREWFEEQLKPYNLDPATTTLFQSLEVDYKASHLAEAAH